MKRFLACFALFCIVWVSPGFCHPHVFVDATVQVLFDDKGLVAIKNHWVYDEMYSSAMMSSGDVDGDGKISEKENGWFYQAILGPLSEHNFYNYILQETKFLKADKVDHFKASMQNGRLVLDFDVIVSSPAIGDYTMLVVVVADPSNYIQVTADMENAGVDGPDQLDIEYFNDGLDGLTLLRAFQSSVQGLFLRFRRK